MLLRYQTNYDNGLLNSNSRKNELSMYPTTLNYDRIVYLKELYNEIVVRSVI